MGRWSEKKGVKRGPWTAEEDEKLTVYIQKHGHGTWRAVPEKAGLQRCGKSCRLRWINYLRPDIKRGKFSTQEEQSIIQLHALLGNRWSAIATHLPKRTDNEIKNHWNTHLKKRLMKMGIDPMTHKPRRPVSAAGGATNKNATNLSHMAQWESARLEAEARLVRESKKAHPNAHHLSGRSAARPANSNPTKPKFLDVLKAWQGVVASMFNIWGRDLESPTSTLSFQQEIPHAPAAAKIVQTANGFQERVGNNYDGVNWLEEPLIVTEGGHDAVSLEGLCVAFDGDAGFTIMMNGSMSGASVADSGNNNNYWDTVSLAGSPQVF